MLDLLGICTVVNKLINRFHMPYLKSSYSLIFAKHVHKYFKYSIIKKKINKNIIFNIWKKNMPYDESSITIYYLLNRSTKTSNIVALRKRRKKKQEKYF